MSITSYVTWVFIAVSLFLYYLTPYKFRHWVLLAASAVFYVLSCGLFRFGIMCGLALLTWFSALMIKRKSEQYSSKILAATIICLVITLIIFKDIGFFTDNINIVGSLFGAKTYVEPPKLEAPIGISYFTLMLISYVIDVRRGKIEAEHNPLKVILYTCYFPQMLLGPITRYSDIGDDLFAGHKFNYDNFMFGLQRAVWGLFKKLIIAERLSIIVGTIYGNYETLGGGYVAIGAIAYVGQLYADFSGAIDIVIGISQMFGIKLPENFTQPFTSRSLAEFWRRWHITLGAWVRDYIYIPLGGNRKGLARQIFNTAIVWFVTGFWHGGSWKWIVGLGVFSFLIITTGKLLQPISKKLVMFLHINTDAWSWHLFQSIRTFLLFTVCIATTRAKSFSDALKFFGTLFIDVRHNFESILGAWADKSIYSVIGLDEKDMFILFLGLLILLIISTLQLTGSVRERIAKQNLPFRWIIYLGMLAAVIVFGMYGVNYKPADFIYAGF